MSHVTNILLCTAIDDGRTGKDEHPNANALSAWLIDEYGDANALKKLDHMATGGKAMQADVFGVAVNYCNIDGLVAKFMSIPWERRESAQLMVKDEDWDGFRTYEAADTVPKEPKP